MSSQIEGLKALGVSRDNNKDLYQYDNPDVSILEKFPWERRILNMLITLDCPEFTSLCPMTGHPDFGHISIMYSPKDWCVESKSLKLYLMTFRNYGAFHESCVQKICDDLVKLLDPYSITVKGSFNPRGGISINPEASWTMT